MRKILCGAGILSILSQIMATLDGLTNPNNIFVFNWLSDLVNIETTEEGLVGFKWIMQLKSIIELANGCFVIVGLLLLLFMLWKGWFLEHENDSFIFIVIAINILPLGLMSGIFLCLRNPMTLTEFWITCVLSIPMFLLSLFLLKAGFNPLKQVLRELIYG